jgi:hypothetical protein
MPDVDRPPDARPFFRQLAIGLSIVLFFLAAVFTFAAPQVDDFARNLCIGIGAMMLVIGATGSWPPRKG